MPVILALLLWHKENQIFRVILSYMVIWKSAETYEIISNTHTHTHTHTHTEREREREREREANEGYKCSLVTWVHRAMGSNTSTRNKTKL